MYFCWVFLECHTFSGESVERGEEVQRPLYSIWIPLSLSLFADIHAVPLNWKIVLLAVPFTIPMLAARASLTGDYPPAILGIVYTAFTPATLYVAAKIFTTEKILTLRIRLRRSKAEEE